MSFTVLLKKIQPEITVILRKILIAINYLHSTVTGIFSEVILRENNCYFAKEERVNCFPSTR